MRDRVTSKIPDNSDLKNNCSKIREKCRICQNDTNQRTEVFKTKAQKYWHLIREHKNPIEQELVQLEFDDLRESSQDLIAI